MHLIIMVLFFKHKQRNKQSKIWDMMRKLLIIAQRHTMIMTDYIAEEDTAE